METRMKELMNWLMDQANLDSEAVEHFRMQVQSPKTRGEACRISHWITIDAVEPEGLHHLVDLMSQYQNEHLQLDVGDSWELEAENRGLLQPSYLVTLQLTFHAAPKAQ